MIEYTVQMWSLALDGDRQGVLFWIVIYTFIVMSYSLVRQLLARKWPSTRGRLIHADIKQWGVPEILKSDQDYKADSLYEYSVNGVSYTGKRVSPWVIIASHNARFILQRQLNKIQKVGVDGVVVYYSPRNPKKSFLIKPSMVGVIVTFLIAIVPVVVFWVEFS